VSNCGEEGETEEVSDGQGRTGGLAWEEAHARTRRGYIPHRTGAGGEDAGAPGNEPSEADIPAGTPRHPYDHTRGPVDGRSARTGSSGIWI
jgi:hypothetical protein